MLAGYTRAAVAGVGLPPAADPAGVLDPRAQVVAELGRVLVVQVDLVGHPVNANVTVWSASVPSTSSMSTSLTLWAINGLVGQGARPR